MSRARAEASFGTESQDPGAEDRGRRRGAAGGRKSGMPCECRLRCAVRSCDVRGGGKVKNFKAPPPRPAGQPTYVRSALGPLREHTCAKHPPMLCGTHLRKLYTFLRKARGDDSRKPRAKPASAAVVSPSPDGGTNKQLHNDALLRPSPPPTLTTLTAPSRPLPPHRSSEEAPSPGRGGRRRRRPARPAPGETVRDLRGGRVMRRPRARSQPPQPMAREEPA